MGEEGIIKLLRTINEEVQMSNIKGQLKPQCLMSNFGLCHLGFGIGLSFGSWNLSLDL